MHVRIFQKQVRQVNGEIFHENVSINFADINFEQFSFGIRRCNIVNKIFSSEFFETLLRNLLVGEVVAAANVYKTPIEMIIEEAQHDSLVYKVVLRTSREKPWKFFLLFPLKKRLFLVLPILI